MGSAVLGENLNKTVVWTLWTPKNDGVLHATKNNGVCVCVCSRVFVSHPYSIGYNWVWVNTYRYI